MKPASVVLFVAATLSGGVFAAPTAVVSPPMNGGPVIDFQQYSGGPAVGNGAVSDDNTLYFIDEQQIAGVKSYLIFFEPNPVGLVQATITFDTPVLGLITKYTDLQFSQNYAAAGITYDFVTNSGLDVLDAAKTSFAGKTVTLDWATANPGDHMRVLTSAVPEASHMAMFTLGLAALGAFGLRRRRAD